MASNYNRPDNMIVVNLTQDIQAYDRLPPEIRMLLRYTHEPYSAITVWDFYSKYGLKETLAALRDRAYLEKEAA